MKFTVYYQDNVSGAEPAKHYEASNIAQVYRHLLNDRVLDYISSMYADDARKIKATAEMCRLKCHHDDGLSEQECETHPLLSSEASLSYLEYQNINVKDLDSIHNRYENMRATNDRQGIDLLAKECLALLSNKAVTNIFHYYMTPGHGYQSGDPYSEHTGYLVVEYTEPVFIDLK